MNTRQKRKETRNVTLALNPLKEGAMPAPFQGVTSGAKQYLNVSGEEE